jgi:hypothetical protein
MINIKIRISSRNNWNRYLIHKYKEIHLKIQVKIMIKKIVAGNEIAEIILKKMKILKKIILNFHNKIQPKV